jgi:hypothetical protein
MQRADGEVEGDDVHMDASEGAKKAGSGKAAAKRGPGKHKAAGEAKPSDGKHSAKAGTGAADATAAAAAAGEVGGSSDALRKRKADGAGSQEEQAAPKRGRKGDAASGKQASGSQGAEARAPPAVEVSRDGPSPSPLAPSWRGSGKDLPGTLTAGHRTCCCARCRPCAGPHHHRPCRAVAAGMTARS